MKKSILKDIESIKEKRNLSEKVQKKIKDRAISNWSAILIYNISSIVLLIFTLAIFEIAYKKDNNSIAICGIEMLAISIFTLFSPYIFFKFSNEVIYSIMAIIAVYYIVKILRIYQLEKKKYLLELSDITYIVKKESKDELAKEFENKRKEQKATKKIATKKSESKKTEKKKNTKKKTQSKNKTQIQKNITKKKSTKK